MSDSIIKNKSFHFAIRIVKLYKFLQEGKKEYVLSKQLLRSGTAVGALVREAQNAESKADFIHKFKIAAKEADETKYWTLLCKLSKNYPDPAILIEELKSISKIITSIIATSKKSK